jgi:GT2 family glycosyltransferase
MKNSNDSPQFRVAVVTPVFNDPGSTLKFLKSLKQQDFKSFRTIIVDMGGDNTGELVRHKYPDTIVIKEGDIFWSGGTNAGVRYVLGRNYEFVFIVNNDVILEKSCLQNLVAFADAHPGSIVGSMVCYQNDPERVWYFGGYISFNGNLPHAEGRTNDFFTPSETEWLTGMGVLVPTQTYRDIGLYDAEHFPQYLADADFSIRAKRDGGYALWVTPDARLFFDSESSWFGNRRRKPMLKDIYDLLFDVRSPMNLRSRYAFFRRHLNCFRTKYILFILRYIPSVCLRIIHWQVVYILKQNRR